jgi:hypothetical protein
MANSGTKCGDNPSEHETYNNDSLVSTKSDERTDSRPSKGSSVRSSMRNFGRRLVTGTNQKHNGTKVTETAAAGNYSSSKNQTSGSSSDKANLPRPAPSTQTDRRSEQHNGGSATGHIYNLNAENQNNHYGSGHQFNGNYQTPSFTFGGERS